MGNSNSENSLRRYSQVKSEELLTLSEVQSLLSIKSRKTILKYIRSGRLTAFKLGGTRWRIAKRSLSDFIERDE